MLDALLATPAVLRLVDLALEEDLGRGDVTTEAVIDRDATATAQLVARESLVLAGLGLCTLVFQRVDAEVVAAESAKDGDRIAAGTAVASYRGRAASLLAAERTALNFVQRLSGTATLARAFVEAAAGSRLRIADTRKTTPGFRLLEKYAVRVGGASNHRCDLGSGLLIKDNHVAVAGGVRQAVEKARGRAPHGLRIEVEVDSLAELEEALAAGADVILLDNFSPADLDRAVARTGPLPQRPLLEVSGGVTLRRIPELARAGVDIVSVGALTHSARAVDLSLDIGINGPGQ
ncbi:MAG: carboxylating nicotinate-nucleotide diphosphorylase [Deltaproteobacteria bacterium]|jgi:nicotinate-nucleotide pyrophosphorylase (carboxylating)|nr:carboxylating nicotinate-nucleotide diphosphorylase [Deltaproteobacteria bacterium]